MAGWSVTSDSPSLSVLETLRKLQSVGFCSDLDAASGDLSDEKLSSAFDRILSVFFQEIHQPPEIRPLPAMLGNGQFVDLFKLYFSVRGKGGYDTVTASRGWGSVAEGIGMDSGVASSLKLVYIKYLGAIDRWLQVALEKKAMEGELGLEKEKFRALVGELRTEVSGILSEITEVKKEGEIVPASGLKKGHQFLTLERENGRRLLLADGGSIGKEDESCDKDNDGDNDDDVMVMEPNAVVSSGFSLHKRKREALVGMLNWVLRVAKNPSDPSVGKFFSSDGLEDRAFQAVGEFYSHALLARKAMFLKKIRRKDTDEPISQKGKRVHPSIYEENTGADTMLTEKIRSGQRRHSSNKHSHSSSCSEASTIRDGDTDKGDAASGEEASHGKRKLRNSSDLHCIIASLFKDQIQKRIPIGPFFQVKVPELINKASVTSYDDDSKWLGTRIWPPENQEKMVLIKQDPIGKGRQDGCRCESPGSVECVRFHVVEKRLQLKKELSSAFHSWRFDRMGEEVSLSWTEDEAQKFKSIVRLNPPYLNKNFWDQLYLCFPFKGRRNLVSYYFNVFLLGRRSYQNRVTPSNIDSDDEETEFGFLSNHYGQYAIKVRDPKSTFCPQNTQCIDIEE